MKIKVTDFARKHFDPKSGGTKITDMTVEEFENEIDKLVCSTRDHRNNWEDIKSLDESEAKVVDGYAPFCKLVFVKNFTNAKLGSMEIKIENYQYLRSGYHARTDKELPVLTRWFELPLPAPTANFLCLVLYSKEQIESESKGQDNATEMFGFDADWGIVAILAQGSDNEEPMSPITMIRNAGYYTEEFEKKAIEELVKLFDSQQENHGDVPPIMNPDEEFKAILSLQGILEGGSGVPLNKEKYAKSVEFWKNRAVIKS